MGWCIPKIHAIVKNEQVRKIKVAKYRPSMWGLGQASLRREVNWDPMEEKVQAILVKSREALLEERRAYIKAEVCSWTWPLWEMNTSKEWRGCALPWMLVSHSQMFFISFWSQGWQCKAVELGMGFFLTGKALLLWERMAGKLPLVDKKGHVPRLHSLQW